MPKKNFHNPFHVEVQTILNALNKNFLSQASCYFGGGTRIVMELGEYRESRDIDFLCASQAGYRLLRESVSENSLGAVVAKPLILAREVRSDQYGIRTFIVAPVTPATPLAPVADANLGTKVKFEIIREARIALSSSPGPALPGITVPVLSHTDAFAEKFLANADRGLDVATNSRDIIDLAFMLQGWRHDDAAAGWQLATDAYGNTIETAINAVTSKMKRDLVYRKKCFDTLQISATKQCMAGIEMLASGKWRS
jgi:hypothetical protein